MSNFFYANLAGEGYSFVSTSESSPSLIDLEFTEESTSANVWAALQRVMDNLEDADALGPFISIAKVSSSPPPALAYGIRSTISDEHGRSGVIFVHIVETSGTTISSAVLAATRILANAPLRDLEARVAELASGVLEPSRFLHDHGKFLREQVASPSDRVSQAKLVGARSRPLRSVTYDVGGTPAAWLAMALSHTDLEAPWQISESVSLSGRRVESTARGATDRRTLSDLLFESVVDWLLVSKQGYSTPDSSLHTTPTSKIGSPSPSPRPPRMNFPRTGIVAGLQDWGSFDRETLHLLSELGFHTLHSSDCTLAILYPEALLLKVPQLSFLGTARGVRHYWVPTEGLNATDLDKLQTFAHCVRAQQARTTGLQRIWRKLFDDWP